MKLPNRQPYKIRRLPNYLRVLGFLALFSAVPCRAEETVYKPEILLSASANCAYLESPFSLPFSFEAQMGLVVSQFYVGYGMDYWLGSDASSSKLNYAGISAEVGWIKSNPRLFWLITAAAIYPVVLGVTDASSQNYTSAAVPLSYRVRAVAGLRLYPQLALTVGGGYRLQDLGNLAAGGTSYNSGALNMTGIFFTAGLSVTL
jgi:hypothetical protein